MPVENPARKAGHRAGREGGPQCPGQERPQKLEAEASASSFPTSDTCDKLEPIQLENRFSHQASDLTLSMIYIFFLDFKCLVILEPSLDILYCAVSSSMLHYTLLSNISGLQFFSESILRNTSTGKSFTQSIPLIYLNNPADRKVRS